MEEDTAAALEAAAVLEALATGAGLLAAAGVEEAADACTELATFVALCDVRLLVLVSCELTKELVDETKGVEVAEEETGVADDEAEREDETAGEDAGGALDATDAAIDELL